MGGSGSLSGCATPTPTGLCKDGWWGRGWGRSITKRGTNRAHYRAGCSMTRLTLTLLIILVAPTVARPDSLWERRDPYNAYLFQDYRARRVGDLLTIVVNEATEFDAQEKREM